MDDEAIVAKMLEGPECEISEEDEKMLNDDGPHLEEDEDSLSDEILDLLLDRDISRADILERSRVAEHELQSEPVPPGSSERVEVSETEPNQNNESISEGFCLEDDQLILTTEIEERFSDDEEKETEQQTKEIKIASPNCTSDSGKDDSDLSKWLLSATPQSGRRISASRGRRASTRNLLSSVKYLQGTNKVNQNLFRNKIFGTNQPNPRIFTEMARHQSPALQAVPPQAATNYFGPALEAVRRQTAANYIRSNSSCSSQAETPRPNMQINRGPSLSLRQSSLYVFEETNPSNERQPENDLTAEPDDECQVVLSVIKGKAYKEVKNSPPLTLKIEVINLDSDNDEELSGFQPLVESKKYPRERSQELEYRGCRVVYEQS